ncbi:MAG: MarR family transcriptional regulator [Microbacterium sp.]|uniref:MarR family winged helix-turn-helix transcriptional regulator n=1 Tax=Microbacterium sp. TaxID=51671 RepID=UPI0039E5E2F6
MTDPEDLALALRAAATRLARRLRAEAHQSEYSDAQIAVIRRLLTDGSATTSALARAEGVRPQSMAATVASLEAAGMVVRRPDPGDQRASQVSLTDTGRQQIEAGRDLKQQWLTRALTERLGADELDDLARAVDLVERLLQS